VSATPVTLPRLPDHRGRGAAVLAWSLGFAFAVAGHLDCRAQEPAAHAADTSAGASPEADVLRLGALRLQACEIGAPRANGATTQAAYCTRFEVPEDWAQPQGRHISLRVAIVRSLAQEADRDIVTFLDGGPGGAASEDYPALAGALAPLRKHHHILLIDQRGTGGSNLLSCGEALAFDADRRPGTVVRGSEEAHKDQATRIHACLAKLADRAAPQFYATSDAIRDLEAVRLALGGAPLDLVGVSYGTRVAQQYAAQYPDAVRSVVLDSAVPNRLVLLSEHARNLEDAVQRRLAQCTADPPCKERFGDSYASLREVLARLRVQPQSALVPDPQSFELKKQNLGPDELAALVRFYMYSAATSVLLPYVIHEAHEGRTAPLLGQTQLVVGDIADRMSGGMAASVLCTEDADLLQERAQDEQTLLGVGAIRAARAACAVWPHGARPPGFHEPFRSQVPVLVLAGEFDPVTPRKYGEEIVAQLGRARLLVAPGQGHAVIGAGCLPRLVNEFVQKLDPANLDDACLQRLGSSAPFLTVNGPAP
jgi:pimeloyl-ACP methyl ester carboxylesterase